MARRGSIRGKKTFSSLPRVEQRPTVKISPPIQCNHGEGPRSRYNDPQLSITGFSQQSLLKSSVQSFRSPQNYQTKPFQSSQISSHGNLHLPQYRNQSPGLPQISSMGSLPPNIQPTVDMKFQSFKNIKPQYRLGDPHTEIQTRPDQTSFNQRSPYFNQRGKQGNFNYYGVQTYRNGIQPEQQRFKTSYDNKQPLHLSRVGLGSPNSRQRHKKCVQKSNLHSLQVLKTSQDASRNRTRRGNQDLSSEFASNLQKQIYFLELEQKLLKQQDMRASNAQMRDDPLNEYLQTIKLRYTQLQNTKQNQIKKTAEQNEKLFTQHYKYQILTQHINNQYSLVYQQYRESNQNFRVELDSLNKKLYLENQEKQEIEKRLEEVNKQKQLSKVWADQLLVKFEKQQFSFARQKKKYQQMQTEKHEKIELKNYQIKELQQKISELESQIHSDSGIVQIQAQINDISSSIQENLQAKQKFSIKAKSLEFSKQILQRNCVEVGNEKKYIIQQIEELQIQFEKLKLSQEALLTKKLREKDNRDLKLMIKSIEDTRREAHMASLQFKQKQSEETLLTDQQRQLYLQFQIYDSDYKRIQNSLNSIQNYSQNCQSQIKHAQSYLQQLFQTHIDMKKEKQRLNIQVEQIRENNAEVRGKIIYYTKQMENQDIVSNFSLEDLRKLSKSNLEINESIHQLIGKWDGIQQFSNP